MTTKGGSDVTKRKASAPKGPASGKHGKTQKARVTGIKARTTGTGPRKAADSGRAAANPRHGKSSAGSSTGGPSAAVSHAARTTRGSTEREWGTTDHYKSGPLGAALAANHAEAAKVFRHQLKGPVRGDAVRAGLTGDAVFGRMGESIAGVTRAPVIWPDFSKPSSLHREKPKMTEETKERLREKSKTIRRDVGDYTAEILAACTTLDEVYVQAAKVLGEKLADLKAKYKHLNPGQQRMVCGNRMRALIKKQGGPRAKA